LLSFWIWKNSYELSYWTKFRIDAHQSCQVQRVVHVLRYSMPNPALPLIWKQEGATTEEIDRLLKFKFHKTGDYEKVNGEIQESFGGMNRWWLNVILTRPLNVLSPMHWTGASHCRWERVTENRFFFQKKYFLIRFPLLKAGSICNLIWSPSLKVIWLLLLRVWFPIFSSLSLIQFWHEYLL